MSNYTKNQIESGHLSAFELADSWTSGQGNPDVNYPDSKRAVKQFLQTNVIDPNVLQARGILELIRTGLTDKFKTALLAGYAGGPNHYEQYNKKVTVQSKPLEGHVMTSNEWLQSCFDKLPPLPEPDYITASNKINAITESMTKAQIWAAIVEIQYLINVKHYTTHDLPVDQVDKYYDLFNKEIAIDEATSALSVYLDDIKPIKGSDNSIQGKYFRERGTITLLNQMLSEEGWKILVSTPMPTTYIDTTYTEVKEGEHILFSIKVID